MKSTIAFAALLLSATVPFTGAFADSGDGLAGHFQIRLRLLGVLPDAGATTYVGGVNSHTSTTATDSLEPEVDGTYFITDHMAVEAIAAVTHHSVHNSALGNVGSVWLLPPTITVQYHLQPTDSFIRPYVGAGINYTWFFSPKSSLVHDLHFGDNVGWALQAGFDVPIGEPYFLNVDAKKLFLNTTATAPSAQVVSHAHLNPWIIGAGVGIRF